MPNSSPVHFVYHVPKCAGSTIDYHLGTSLPASSYYRTRKRRARHYRVMPDSRTLRVIGGHYLGISVEPLFEGRDVRRSLLLRDPVSHVVSYYNFRMMRYIAAGFQPYDFDLAYEATQRNFVSHYILRNFLEFGWLRIMSLSSQDKYDLVNAFLSSFWYVGDYKCCDDLVAALGGELGIAPTASLRNTRAEWERRVRWTSLNIEDLSTRDIARIRQDNLIDQRLWETWREARTEAHFVRPLPLGASARPNLLGKGVRRLVSQIRRRIHRRFGNLKGVQLASPKANTAVSLRS